MSASKLINNRDGETPEEAIFGVHRVHPLPEHISFQCIAVSLTSLLGAFFFLLALPLDMYIFSTTFLPSISLCAHYPWWLSRANFACFCFLMTSVLYLPHRMGQGAVHARGLRSGRQVAVSMVEEHSI